MATLVPVSESSLQWRVVDGEGGHATLAIANHLDAELWGVLSQEVDYVSRETVLCGSGLVRLYRAMCAVWGSHPEALDAAQVSARGVTMTDPVCHQTLESFCGLLGNTAGDFALTVGARGGVYIAGGIAPKIVDFLSASPLRRRFDERGPMSAYVSQIPIYIVLDDNPGLVGAMRYSVQLDHSGANASSQVSD
jgi:glucokinase